MAGNQLSLAYLRARFSKDEREELDQSLKERISTLRPNIDSLETRRRVRRTPREIQERESHVSESITAYRSNSRGQQPYCHSRMADSGSRPYRPLTRDCPCDCGTSHKVPNPKEWQASPAEEPEWDYNLLNGGHAIRRSKVTFADPIVADVREFERWYADSYGCFSRTGITNDRSTEADDEKEIRMLDAADLGFTKIVEKGETRGRELVKSISDRQDSKCWRGDALSFGPSSKEVSAGVKDNDEVKEQDVTKPARSLREGRPRVKNLRKVATSRGKE